MWEMWVQSLGQEDPLEKGMATHSSILALKIPWTEETGGLQSIGSQRVGNNWSDLAHMYPNGKGRNTWNYFNKKTGIIPFQLVLTVM